MNSPRRSSTGCRPRRRRCLAAISTMRAAASCSRRSPIFPNIIRRARRRRSWPPMPPISPIAYPRARSSSNSALAGAKQRLNGSFPALHVHPIVGNFTDEIVYPSALQPRPKIGFFPGSTIGNLTPAEARELLAGMGHKLGPDGRLIIGVDLKKDAHTLVAAYNDAAGVTAAFNLNLLTRINRELSATFDLTQFRHEAVYNPRDGRIEMYLASEPAQQVSLLGHTFAFAKAERIHTENSYKYTVDEFQTLAREAGWQPEEVWTDKDS